ncbi:MAG TPA: phosphoribosylamine--glycine ligase [Solirubrobacteraceae bacterium]|nr:phosphoribosylamine--glycine ligase [Solirubrobacteraceae bacterium]
MKTLIVGNGGRESALAAAMAAHSELHAFVGHENPSIVRHAAASGGSHQIGDVCDAHAVAAFARAKAIDIAMVSADEPLAAGVVDALLAQGTRAVGPTAAGAEIEWNKTFARSLLAELAPEALPRLKVVHDASEVADAIAAFGATPVVVKPSGLTAGKGVKVMGPHLADHRQAHDYALELLARGKVGETVLIEEKIVGAEFTIQAISDGRTVVFPPSTYDYPYRFDGDRGPGTGGMGSLSMARATLPFMTDAHYQQACSIIERVIERLTEHGRHFSGVMNSGFFATADGVKVIEFNARFGDPECMNIMSLFSGSWPEVMQRIAAASLAPADVHLRPEASVVLYLVSPDYALRPGDTYEFTLERERIEADGCRVFFSSAVQIAENAYRTVGTSRAVALASTAPTLEQARARVAECAASVPVLEWRRDVGDERYLQELAGLVSPAVAARDATGLTDRQATGEAADGAELLPNAS